MISKKNRNFIKSINNSYKTHLKPRTKQQRTSDALTRTNEHVNGCCKDVRCLHVEIKAFLNTWLVICSKNYSSVQQRTFEMLKRL